MAGTQTKMSWQNKVLYELLKRTALSILDPTEAKGKALPLPYGKTNKPKTFYPQFSETVKWCTVIIRMCWRLWRTNVCFKNTQKLWFSFPSLFPVVLSGTTREETLLKCYSKFLSLVQNLNLGPLIALDRRQLAQQPFCDLNEAVLPLASSLLASCSQPRWSSQHCEACVQEPR